MHACCLHVSRIVLHTGLTGLTGWCVWRDCIFVVLGVLRGEGLGASQYFRSPIECSPTRWAMLETPISPISSISRHSEGRLSRKTAVSESGFPPGFLERKSSRPIPVWSRAWGCFNKLSSVARLGEALFFMLTPSAWGLGYVVVSLQGLPSCLTSVSRMYFVRQPPPSLAESSRPDSEPSQPRWF